MSLLPNLIIQTNAKSLNTWIEFFLQHLFWSTKEQQDGFELAIRRILFYFGLSLGPGYIICSSARNLSFHFVWRLIAGNFLSIPELDFARQDFQIAVFARKML